LIKDYSWWGLILAHDSDNLLHCDTSMVGG